MKETKLRREHLEIINTLQKLNAIDITSSVKVTDILETIKKDTTLRVSDNFVRKGLEMLILAEIVAEGFTTTKNARTFYLKKENVNQFLEAIMAQKQ